MRLPNAEERCSICFFMWTLVLICGLVLGFKWVIETQVDLQRDAHEWRNFVEHLREKQAEAKQ